MDYRDILYDKEDKVVTITFNRPHRLNAILIETARDIRDAFKRAGDDEEVRVIVLTGAGRNFSTGGDNEEQSEVAQMNPGDLQEKLWEAHQLVIDMRKLEKPIVAKIRGPVYGAGVDIACACDLRIAASDATFCEAYLGLALTPGMGALWLLPRYVGMGRALNLLLTSKVIDANEAERIGLVDVVVPLDKLEETTKEYVTALANGPTKAFGVMKRALLRGLTSSLEEEQLWTTHEQAIQYLTRDAQEGLHAFLGKRKPEYTGRW